MNKIPVFFPASTVNENEIRMVSNLELKPVQDLSSFNSLNKIIKSVSTEYFIICKNPLVPDFDSYSISRMVQVAEDSGAGMLYSDFHELKDGKVNPHPLNDYQTGSIRDDFDFGPVLFFRTKAANIAVDEMPADVKFAALYDLRLAVSRKNPVVHVEEYLYTSEDSDKLSSEQKQFAYVDPKNRSVQIEMEEVCTNHLKKINAWFPPVFEETDPESGDFEVTASVIIPVRNRAKTISDAIESVLNQKTSFSFNCIIIDNHSTDGTSDIIKNKAAEDKRIVHIIPERNDLGIGGCWNLGIHDERCGRFAIQLDSDDVYSGDDTIEKIVAGFYEQKCAMLVGSYRMCNFDLETIPPGIIDHKEWTLENGRNNALRINGLGAPRAFLTRILRTINIPNVSYGEDYALGLQFSRRWKIGRIFDVLYLCRRWEDNSDASIDIVKLNKYNHYKDKLRSYEISARQNINTQII